MVILHAISIILEAFIVAIGILLAVKKGKVYGFGIALTFVIYVFYDTAKFLSWPLPPGMMYASFFLATVSIFASVLGIYRDNK